MGLIVILALPSVLLAHYYVLLSCEAGSSVTVLFCTYYKTTVFYVQHLLLFTILYSHDYFPLLFFLQWTVENNIYNANIPSGGSPRRERSAK